MANCKWCGRDSEDPKSNNLLHAGTDSRQNHHMLMIHFGQYDYGGNILR